MEKLIHDILYPFYCLGVYYSVLFSILLTILMFTKKGRKELCGYLKVILKEND